MIDTGKNIPALDSGDDNLHTTDFSVVGSSHSNIRRIVVYDNSTAAMPRRKKPRNAFIPDIKAHRVLHGDDCLTEMSLP